MTKEQEQIVNILDSILSDIHQACINTNETFQAQVFQVARVMIRALPNAKESKRVIDNLVKASKGDKPIILGYLRERNEN